VGDIVRLVRKGRFIGWYIRYKDTDGRRRMRASHQETQAQARRFLLEVEGRVARGLVGIPEPAPPAPTVRELVTRFLGEYSRPKVKDLDAYRRFARTALRRALPLLGALRADAVEPAHLDRLRLQLGKTHAPASVRGTLTYLGTMFGWAVKSRIVTTNPLRGIEKPAAPSALEYLTRDEVRRLLSRVDELAASGTLFDRLRRACVHTALHTGLRRGELLGLRWQDVDLTTRRLTVARSYRTTPKSGKPRHLRLPAALVPVLEAWQPECPRLPEGVVFPIVGGPQPRVGTREDLLELPALLLAAGCRPLQRPWHALRHTFASHFVMSGGNLLALQQILGHSDISQTMAYSHLAPDFLAGEIDRLKF
jgi:integrase